MYTLHHYAKPTQKGWLDKDILTTGSETDHPGGGCVPTNGQILTSTDNTIVAVFVPIMRGKWNGDICVELYTDK